tara:strand:+ start:285 stop:446 length:162 start_codon:yes stop_codon:yes gene_type:complete
MLACIKQLDLRNSVMKKYFLLFALAVGGLFVAGCEAPTVSPDAVSCSKTGGCS